MLPMITIFGEQIPPQRFGRLLFLLRVLQRSLLLLLIMMTDHCLLVVGPDIAGERCRRLLLFQQRRFVRIGSCSGSCCCRIIESVDHVYEQYQEKVVLSIVQKPHRGHCSRSAALLGRAQFVTKCPIKHTHSLTVTRSTHFSRAHSMRTDSSTHTLPLLAVCTYI